MTAARPLVADVRPVDTIAGCAFLVGGPLLVVGIVWFGLRLVRRFRSRR